MSFTPIDLSKLSAPDVVEQIDYKTILAAMINDLQAIDPPFSALVESDPACKILEIAAYREILLRQRINDAARSVMLAFARGSDLEHIAALFGVTRKTLKPANPEAVPPIDAIMEEDEELRFRITLALEGLSTAGPEGSYLFHLLKSPNIKDASVVGPPLVEPGGWKAGEKSTIKLTIDVRSYKYTQNNQVIHDIDIINMTRIVNGKDRLSAQRNALGI